MDDLAPQNDDLQKKLVMLAQRIEKYRTMENSLSTSMINAQRMGDSIIRESKQKAAEIIRSANIKAEDREQRARDDVELAKQEIVTLKGADPGLYGPCSPACAGVGPGTAGSPDARHAGDGLL